MTFVYLAGLLIGALALFVIAVLRSELGLPWLVGTPITLPIVLGGIGLGVALYLLAGGYELARSTPG